MAAARPGGEPARFWALPRPGPFATRRATLPVAAQSWDASAFFSWRIAHGCCVFWAPRPCHIGVPGRELALRRLGLAGCLTLATAPAKFGGKCRESSRRGAWSPVVPGLSFQFLDGPRYPPNLNKRCPRTWTRCLYTYSPYTESCPVRSMLRKAQRSPSSFFYDVYEKRLSSQKQQASKK